MSIEQMNGLPKGSNLLSFVGSPLTAVHAFHNSIQQYKLVQRPGQSLGGVGRKKDETAFLFRLVACC